MTFVLRKKHPPAGSRPGAFTVPADSAPPRFHLFEYGGEMIREAAVDQASDLTARRDDGLTRWLDVTGLGHEVSLRTIGEIFNIHPLALGDVVNVPQRPKSDGYEENHLLIFRMFRVLDDGSIDSEQISLVIGDDWLVTFQEREGDILDPIRGRLRAGGGPMRTSGPAYLAYAILDTIIDGYYPVVELIGDRLEALEVEVLQNDSIESVLGRINDLKRDLLSLRRAIWPQRDAIASLIRDESRFFSRSVKTYLRDTLDHCTQLADVVETYREMATSLFQTYLSVVGNRTNDVMKVLTIMASIFIPLTFIAGIYGMNFAHMPELHWAFGYPMVLGLMLVTSVVLLFWFRRKGWLGRSRRQVSRGRRLSD